MTVPLWCLLVVALLPYALAATGGYYRVKTGGRIDNEEPRVQYRTLGGKAARVFAAQQNAWEAVAFFAAIVLIAQLSGADPDQSAVASIVFLLTRLVHPVLYIANLATLRSLVFVVGLAAGVYMLWLSVVA